MSVFVLDQRKHPLMPCSERRARLLLSRKRAVVHRLWPFTIRLKDRSRSASQVQPMALKLDPGAKTTGMVLVRIEQTQEGEVHHALHLAELTHRGRRVHRALQQRAGNRRRRRSANLRHRPPRFANRVRPKGWLPPSLRSRIGNVLTWARRYRRWAPLSRIEIERVKFDTALLQHPEITGILYQKGELCGWEIRSYLLEKFGRHCVYCGRCKTAFEIDHIVPSSRGGSDRVSNLVLSCHDCNRAKGDRTAAEFGHPRTEVEAQLPLRDAAAVNATRFALVEALVTVGMPIGTWSGGRTRWNRERFGMEKAHALDALCVGEVAGVSLPVFRTLVIGAQGRGSYQRTNVDEAGFPRGYLMRAKRMRGCSSGDLVCARVPEQLKTGGVHVGRVAVRASGSFRVGKTDGINAKYCTVVQRADGYSYALQKDTQRDGASSPCVNAGTSAPQ
jgi:5-methylcytosine-specific restriction endonuclease McrA